MPITSDDLRAGCAADDDARTAVLIGGLPRDVVEAAERRQGRVDWRPLAGALDGLFMAGGGSLPVRRFLAMPSRRFDGRAPVDMILTPGGAGAVARAADELAIRTRLSRVS